MNWGKLAMFGSMVFLGTVTGGGGIAVAGTAIGIAGPVVGGILGTIVVGLDTLLDLALEKIER